MKTQLKRGRKAVRLLDAILRPRFAADPQLLAAWESAKRVRPTTVPPLALAAPTPEIKVA